MIEISQKTKLSAYKARAEQLEEENAKLQKKIKYLEFENRVHEKNEVSMTTYTEKLEQQNDALRDKIDELKAEIADLMEEVNK